MDDEVPVTGKSLEHFGVKGMHWGVHNSVRRAYGLSPVDYSKPKDFVNKTIATAQAHPAKTAAVVYGAFVAKRAFDNREKIVGTARIVSHIIKVLNEQRKTPQGKEALAIGRAFVQGQVIHGIDNAGALLPHDKAVGKGGLEVVAKTMPAAFTKDPTAAQRKLLAKMGIAMPDGSFYIRNGPVGASDLQNAIDSVGRGESDGTSGNAIRLHIMKRAAVLKLTSKIPSDWNADGSLKEMKHGETIGNSDTVEHFGVKGMHWGVEHTKAELLGKARAHEAVAKDLARGVENIKTHQADLAANDVHSDIFKKAYGDQAPEEGTGKFLLRTGRSKTQALEETRMALVNQKNANIRDINLHAKQAAKLRAKAAKLQHGETTEFQSEDVFVEDHLQHFGVKGMHWGVERSRSAKEDHLVSDDEARASRTRATIQKHGIGAVSSGDLQHLVSRQNLMKQHAGLNAPKVGAGHKFLDDLVKAQVTAANKEAGKYVGEYAAKGAVWLGQEATRQLLGTKAGAGRHS